MSLKDKIGKVLKFDISFAINNEKNNVFGIQTGFTTNAKYLEGGQFSLINFIEQGGILQCGAINCANEIKGFQIGAANLGVNCDMAIQISPLLINIAQYGDTQIGPINYCVALEDGVQYGGINLALYAEGIQSGIINLVTNGKNLWQFGALNFNFGNPWYAMITPLVNYSVDMEKHRKKQKLKLEDEVLKIKATKKKEGNDSIVHARF